MFNLNLYSKPVYRWDLHQPVHRFPVKRSLQWNLRFIWSTDTTIRQLEQLFTVYSIHTDTTVHQNSYTLLGIVQHELLCEKIKIKTMVENSPRNKLIICVNTVPPKKLWERKTILKQSYVYFMMLQIKLLWQLNFSTDMTVCVIALLL